MTWKTAIGILLGCVVAGLTIQSVRRSPNLGPAVLKSGERLDMEAEARSGLVAGIKVTGCSWASWWFSAKPGAPDLRLVEVRGDVDGSFANKLPAGPIVFYFYADSRYLCGDKRDLHFEPGERSIVFLHLDGDRLRLATDVWGLQFPLTGTASLTNKDAPGESLTTWLVRALLTPAEDQAEAFGFDLSRKLDSVQSHIDPRLLILGLIPLRSNPNLLIQEAACIGLADLHWYKDTCLTASGAWVNEALRTRAQRLMESRPSADQRLALVHELVQQFEKTDRVPPKRETSAVIQLLTHDVDPGVRTEACRGLARLGAGSCQ
jgi:hypothetical protein